MPTHQDGNKNRDKVYNKSFDASGWPQNCFGMETQLKFIFEEIASVAQMVNNFFFEWTARAVQTDDNFFRMDSPIPSDG